jgi:predicted nucleic acid-binding protein
LINAVFLDSDVILDVAMARNPFVLQSKTVLAMAQTKHFNAFTSPVCVANIYYILRKATGDIAARDFLLKLLSFVSVLPVDHQITLDALRSRIADFEDALQCGTALQNRCDCIITRNIGDFQTAHIHIFTPSEFLRIYAAPED